MQHPFHGPGRRALCVAAGTLFLVTGCGGGGKKNATATPPPAPAAVSTSPAVAAPVKALKRSVPERLVVPKLKIDSPVMKLGLNSDSTIQVPPMADPKMTGWWEKGATPGEKGASVILGHNASASNRPYVFYKLGDLKPGDRFQVKRADGSVAEFAVSKVKQIPKSKFPTQAVYGKLDYPGIRLITCGGRFNASWGHHVDNVIVFGKLVGSH